MGGKITVTNFSENELSVNITQNNQPNAVPLASGYLNVGQTSGFVVSGSNLYEVVFSAVGSNAISANGVTPNSIVELAITDATTEGETNE